MERLEKAKNWGVEVENEKRLAKLAKVILIVSLIASMLVIVLWHYKIFCVNAKYGIQYGFRIFYLIALQNEENYEREESCSA